MSPRMRLLNEAYQQLLIDDPNTSVTKYALRSIVKSGKVNTVKLGRKTLINYDSLLDYLKNGSCSNSKNNASFGEIRRVY